MIHPQTDPELAALLVQVPLEPIDWDNLPRQRQISQTRVVERLQRAAAPDGVTIDNRQVQATNSTPPIPLRIYRPALGSDDLPGVYVIHGGGLVLGNLDSLELNWVRLNIVRHKMPVMLDHGMCQERDAIDALSRGPQDSHSPEKLNSGKRWQRILRMR
ncbi:MAG: hypothetical protein M1499_08130 [Firmicutes bacterium]|nr:hypothetical protein [Bacillota bacterium]